MAQAPRIATATVMVVVSAFGALTGSTSSSTCATTASARASPTNTTNAYISSCLLRRRTARRSPQFDPPYDPWLQITGGFFFRWVTAQPEERSKKTDGRRPGAGQSLSAGRARRAGRAHPGDVRRRLRVVPAHARRPRRSIGRDAGGVRAGYALRA